MCNCVRSFIASATKHSKHIAQCGQCYGASLWFVRRQITGLKYPPPQTVLPNMYKNEEVSYCQTQHSDTHRIKTPLKSHVLSPAASRQAVHKSRAQGHQTTKFCTVALNIFGSSARDLLWTWRASDGHISPIKNLIFWEKTEDIPEHAWRGPLGSRGLRLPGFLNNRHMKVHGCQL
jgi:hypothetical protein